MCAKFDAFTRFVTIFPLTDRTNIKKCIYLYKKYIVKTGAQTFGTLP